MRKKKKKKKTLVYTRDLMINVVNLRMKINNKRQKQPELSIAIVNLLKLI